MKAKKSFGQHFLINQSLSRSIVDLAVEKAGDRMILEVGPGKAALTSYLIEDQVNFKAVEADREMIEYLCQTYPEFEDRFQLFDFLKFDFKQANDGQAFMVLGNFPYNISSQILFKIIDNKALVPVILGMFQKEVADRIVSSHGSKSYGVLSLLIQFHYDCKIVFKVSPGSFSPPPKVNSAVVLFEQRKDTPNCNPSLFKSIVKMSFGQRRKMMRNTLKSIIKEDTFLKQEIFKKRPEQLSLSEFVELTNTIEHHIKSN